MARARCKRASAQGLHQHSLGLAASHGCARTARGRHTGARALECGVGYRRRGKCRFVVFAGPRACRRLQAAVRARQSAARALHSISCLVLDPCAPPCLPRFTKQCHVRAHLPLHLDGSTAVRMNAKSRTAVKVCASSVPRGVLGATARRARFAGAARARVDLNIAVLRKAR